MADQFIVYRAKNASAPSEVLLRRAIARFTGMEEAVIRRLPLLRLPLGKPYFPDLPDIHFSVSHSGQIWGCAVGSAPVGLDIQQHKAYDFARLAQRFFHPDEGKFLIEHGYEHFFSVWTAKESYCKFTALGIDGTFSAFSTVADGQLAREVGGAKLEPVRIAEGYSACLCAKVIGEVHCFPLTAAE